MKLRVNIISYSSDNLFKIASCWVIFPPFSCASPRYILLRPLVCFPCARMNNQIQIPWLLPKPGARAAGMEPGGLHQWGKPGWILGEPSKILVQSLVGGLVAIKFIFPLILGMSSSQLTFMFFRGVAQPPTRSCSINKCGEVAHDMRCQLSIFLHAWHEKTVQGQNP